MDCPRRVTAVVGLFLLGSLPMSGGALASSNAMTGEGLLNACTRAEADWISFCNGYIQAAIDLMELQEGSACIPEGTTRNDIYDAVVPLFTDSTRMKSENAFRALTTAISVKFKCE